MKNYFKLHPIPLITTLIFSFFLIFTGLHFWSYVGYQTFTDSTVGEAYIAFHSAINNMRLGPEYAFLEDHATSESLGAHPYLYIHHLNIGILISTLMMYLGIDKLTDQLIITGVIHFSVILAALFAVSSKFKNYRATLLFFSLLLVDINSTSNWAYNLHRGYGDVAIVIMLLAVYRLLVARRALITTYLLGMIGAVLLLGADYMYLASIYVFVFLVVLLCSSNVKKCFSQTITFSVWFLLAFVLRQVQVILGAGYERWSRDFLFQVLNRLGLESLYGGNYSVDTIRFYSEQQIQNPGFAPKIDLLDVYAKILTDFGSITLKYTFGINGELHLFSGFIVGTLVISLSIAYILINYIAFDNFKANLLKVVNLLGVLLCVCMLFGYASNLNQHNLLYYSAFSLLAVAIALVLSLKFEILNSIDLCQTKAISKLVIASIGTVVINVIIFRVYYAQWFASYNLSVIISYLLCTYIILNATRSFPNKYYYSLIVLIIMMRAAPFVSANAFDNIPNRINYEKAVSALNGTVATNFIPESISSYTRKFSTMVSNDGLEFLAGNGYVFPSTQYLLNEKDDKNPNYLLVDYIVLQHSKNGMIDFIRKLNNYPGISIYNSNEYFTIYKIDHQFFGINSYNIDEKVRDVLRDKVSVNCLTDNEVANITWHKPKYPVKGYVLFLGEQRSTMKPVATFGPDTFGYKIPLNSDRVHAMIESDIGMYKGQSEIILCGL